MADDGVIKESTFRGRFSLASCQMCHPSIPKYTKYIVILANVSELNDTIVEAELRILRIPLSLPVDNAKENFRKSKNRLLVMVSSSGLYLLETLLLRRNVSLHYVTRFRYVYWAIRNLGLLFFEVI